MGMQLVMEDASDQVFKKNDTNRMGQTAFLTYAAIIVFGSAWFR